MRDILKRLRKKYGVIDTSEFIATHVRNRGLFEFIVGVMLSQNTSDRNAIAAYERLRRVLSSIAPESVLRAGMDTVSEAIKPAGMYRIRAKRIIELAELFSKPGFEYDLVKYISNASVEDARKKLMELPGIGAKTADVVLLMYFGKPTFPVDTHIARITRRLGVVNKSDYEEIRRFWMNVFKPEEYLEAHLLLIIHGRRTCKARKPLCRYCVIRDYCREGANPSHLN
ncbi:MAG: endonuclease III [Thermoprotei archaeon]